MKILFFALHCGYFRNFDSVLRNLVEGGHSITLSADLETDFGSRAIAERLAAEYEDVEFCWTPRPRGGFWRLFVRELRHAIAFVHFLDPGFDAASTARQVSRERTLSGLVWLCERVRRVFGPRGLAVVAAVLRLMERALPQEPALVEFVRTHDPDMVWITPLLGVSEWQLDELRAAQSHGVRTLFPVNSWDNLSTMAPMRSCPDRVLVWNDTQLRELVEIHGVPAESARVTGAQNFDRWFDRRPAMDRERFCERVGLDAGKPFILYVCSAVLHGSPNEAKVVRRWIEAVRSAPDPALQDVGILVRPHPQRLDFWDDVDLSTMRKVTVWGDNPVDRRSREDYFESLFYSSVVIGLSSTAMVEAAILGKPVHTFLLPEYHRDQKGLVHFHYLLQDDGGLLHAARGLDDHVAALAESLRAAEPDPESSRFAESFVRPHGIDEPAGPRFVRAVEELGREPAPPAVQTSALELSARWAIVYPIMSFTYVPWVAPRIIHWISTRPHEIRQWLRRTGRRLHHGIVGLEKRLMPSAYLMVRAVNSLSSDPTERRRLLLSWALHGAAPPRIESELPDTVGAELPRPWARWGYLYPLVGAAGLAGGLARTLIRWVSEARKPLEMFVHRARKGELASMRRFQSWRSSARMSWHRRKKRIRSLYRRVSSRLKRVLQ